MIVILTIIQQQITMMITLIFPLLNLISFSKWMVFLIIIIIIIIIIIKCKLINSIIMKKKRQLTDLNVLFQALQINKHIIIIIIRATKIFKLKSTQDATAFKITQMQLLLLKLKIKQHFRELKNNFYKSLLVFIKEVINLMISNFYKK